MQNFLKQLMENPILNAFITIIVYCFYALLIGLSLFPSVFFMHLIANYVSLTATSGLVILSLSLGFAFYIFLLTSLIVMGTAQRILVMGFKEGKHEASSPIVARWLIYSGIHVIMINMVMPLVAGTPFNRLYYRILGCKMGKNVFINTAGLHDAYLLELGDNVVIGGKADITCHIFEAGYLILGKIKINSNTLIGSHTLIQPGVTIGERCSIGIYTHIRKNKEIPDGTVLSAVPGMPMRSLVKLEKFLKEEKRPKVDTEK